MFVTNTIMVPREIHDVVEERLDVIIPLSFPDLVYSVTYICEISVVSWWILWEVMDAISVRLVATSSLEGVLPRLVESFSSVRA